MKILSKNLVGFARYRQKDVIASILNSPEAKSTFAELHQKKNQPIRTSRQKAQEMLEELSSAYSANALRVSYWIVRFLKKFMFRDIAVYGDELKEIHQLTAEGKIIFYLPNHKSHMDYLLLSYILFNSGSIAPPHIAAGVNLAFFPVGTMFRKGGAYFIRRKIAGNFLYTKSLQLYFDWMLQQKISQEFYMEGGRSRDGKIREAQSGILTLFVDEIAKRNLLDQVYLVPTGITYDRLPEMQSLIGELKGAQKKTESALSVISSISMLWTDHGQAHVQFGKPIPLSSLIQGDFTKQSFQELSSRVFSEVQKQKTITVTSLIALAALSTPDVIEERELYASAEWLLQFLKPCRMCVSEDVTNLKKDWLAILDRFEYLGWFKVGLQVEVNPDKRMEMNYYKNDVLPTLMPFFQSQSDMSRAILAHEYPYANHLPIRREVSENEMQFLNRLIEPILAFYKAVQGIIEQKNITNLLNKDVQREMLESLTSMNFDYKEMLNTEAVKSACDFFYQRIKQ